MIEDQSDHLGVIMEEENVIEVTVVRKEAGTVKTDDKNRVDQKHHVSVSEPQQKGGV